MEWKQNAINPYSWTCCEWLIRGLKIPKANERSVYTLYLLFRNHQLWARCKTIEECEEAISKPPQMLHDDIAKLWSNWEEIVESDRRKKAMDDYERDTGFRKPMLKTRKR